MSSLATASTVLAYLTGPGAPEVLAQALPRGASIRRLTPKHVNGRPPARVTVRYDAVVRWPDGRERKDMLVAAYGPLPDGVATAIAGGERVALWRVSEDPSLPGMAIALDAARLSELFAADGLREAGFNVKLRAYVPEQRAVLEVSSPGAAGERVFVKVLPPADAQRVVETHERLGAVVPVPKARLIDPSGVVVVRTVDGRTLLETLKQDPAQAPAADEVVAISSAIAEVALERESHVMREQRLARMRESFDSILPEESGRVREILTAITPLEPQPRVAVHGDFHPKQLLIRDGVIAGVLDVDDAGMGAQVDDLATQLAWLAVTADEEDTPALERYRDDLQDAARAVVDARELQRRTVIGVMTSALATYQSATRDWKQRALPRLALAERWSAEA